MMTYEIKKGVPIPAPRRIIGKADPNSLTGTLRRMEVGDSIDISHTQSSAMAVASRLKPKRFTSRSTRSGCSIWRIE